MAEKDSEDTPSLELPSFGFGRKKNKDKPAEPAETAATADPPKSPSVQAPPVRPPTPAAEPTVAERRTPDPRPPAPTGSTPAAPAPAAPPVALPAPATPPVTAQAPAAPPVTAQAPAAPSVAAAESQDKKSRMPSLSFPAIGALQAALAVGALIGVLAVVLTFGSLKLCEVARGTDSCGGGPGLLLLVATLVALTYAGSWLLRGFGISDALSTSFLAVGLLAVVVMTFFLEVIYSRWMVLVIPIVSMAVFALAWWVTTRVVETDDAPRRARDVRYRE